MGSRGGHWVGSVSCLGVTSNVAIVGFVVSYTSYPFHGLPMTGLAQIVDRSSDRRPS